MKRIEGDLEAEDIYDLDYKDLEVGAKYFVVDREDHEKILEIYQIISLEPDDDIVTERVLKDVNDPEREGDIQTYIFGAFIEPLSAGYDEKYYFYIVPPSRESEKRFEEHKKRMLSV